MLLAPNPSNPRRAALLAAAASLATAAALAPSAYAIRQHVDVYTVRLDATVTIKAHTHEGGWSQVDTDTAVSGQVHGRVDGITFVDGVPQQTNSPFTGFSATDLALNQQAQYTSPHSGEHGECRQAVTESTPLKPGLLSTSIGAPADDGSQQVSIAVLSPEDVWINKSCSGYLRYEVADPLLKKGLFFHSYLPITDIGPSFTLPMRGVPECPDFIRIQNCDSRFEGTLAFERTADYDRGEPDPPAPVTPLPPVPGPDATDEEIDTFMLAITVRRAQEDRYAQAVIRCGKPCTGHVSAYAIALSKQGKPTGKAKRIGSSAFRSSARGDAKASIRLSASARRLARVRGAIEVRAEAAPVAGGETVRTSRTIRWR